MTYKPTGRPAGRPSKPFLQYPGWTIKIIKRFAELGDLTDMAQTESSERNCRSAIATFNRARAAYVRERQALGDFKRADIALDIIARVANDLGIDWRVEYEFRGRAINEVLEVQAEVKRTQEQALLAFVSADGASARAEAKLEAMAREPLERNILTEEELAQRAAEIATSRARDLAATEKMRQAQRDADSDAAIDEALDSTDQPASNVAAKT